MKVAILLLSSLLVLGAGAALAQDYAGTYTLEGDGVPFTLSLTVSEGKVQGRLQGDGPSMVLEGRVVSGGIRGHVVGGQGVEPLPFVAQLCPEGDHLLVTLAAEESIELTFDREAPGDERQVAAPSAPSAPSARSGVRVNGVALPESTVRALENRYGVPIQDGDYWYDAVSGAWGYAGGPTAGYMTPDLELGGPLAPDASHGDTGVFVNGRELHAREVWDLRQVVGVVYPGRYWFDAQGNYGLEGGPPMGNLWAIARGSGSRREGILSTYDKTGVAVIGVR